MIALNEAADLPESIACIQPIVHEVCIIDTGSDDDTVEVARRLGAHVESIAWEDDFSTARNASLALCKGEWILVIDPDERIARQDLAKIEDLVKGPPDRGFRFVTRNYTDTLSVSEFHSCTADDPHARGFPGWHPSTKVRLFPNRPGVMFEGEVHELVERSLERLGLQLAKCEVPIHHYPLSRSRDRIAAKHALYVRLGLKRASARPADPKVHSDLGNEYAALGDYANAAASYRKSLRLDPQNTLVLKDLGAVLYLVGHVAEAVKSLTLALKRDPSLPEVWRNLGVIHADQGTWPEALTCFEQAIALDPDWPENHRYLSLALEGVGRLEEAAEEARKAVGSNPNSAEALDLYVRQMDLLHRRAEACAFLKGLVDKGLDSEALVAMVARL